MVKNMLRKVRFMIYIIINQKYNKQFIDTWIKNNVNSDESCPICHSENCRKIGYFFASEFISKNLCTECKHIFSELNLVSDTKRADELFSYSEETENINAHFYLYEKVLSSLRKKQNCNILDFGISGNKRAYMEANKTSNHNFYGCDLYDADYENYFTSYKDDSKLNFFDGIVSSNVLEHIDDTISSWIYLNRLLKMGG